MKNNIEDLVKEALLINTRIKKDKDRLAELKGKILDVVVDCRKKSKTFGKHYKIILSEKNATSIYIPPGFAHGFLALDKENIVLYSCTNYRNKDSEASLSWNDKDLKIKWPIKNPILSERDSKNNPFKKFNFLG